MLLGYELVLGTRWFGYELVVGTSRLGYDLVLGTSWLRYELARYDLEWVRVDLHPPFMTSGQEMERVNYFNTGAHMGPTAVERRCNRNQNIDSS